MRRMLLGDPPRRDRADLSHLFVRGRLRPRAERRERLRRTLFIGSSADPPFRFARLS